MNRRLVVVCLATCVAVMLSACTLGPGAKSSPTPVAAMTPQTAAAALAAPTATAPATAAADLPTPAATRPAPATPSSAAPTATVAPATTTPAVIAVATSAPSPVAAVVTATAIVTVTAAAVVTPTQAALIAASSGSLTLNGRTIKYSYPAGWRIKQETKDSSTLLSFEAPDASLLTLTIYGADMEPKQLAASARDALTKQFPGATAAAATGVVGGYPSEGYTLKFAYNGVPMTGTVLAAKTDKVALTYYAQAADSLLATAQARFDLVRNSLVVQ